MRRLIAIASVIAVFPAAPATADPTLYGEAKDYRVTVLGSWREQPMRGVVPWVDSHFRTLPGRPHRAIAGASSGAFSALHLTARNPDPAGLPA